MTKEELLGALNSKLGTNSNLSARTVNSYAEQMANAMGAEFQMTDEFVESHFNILKSIGGQLSHDITDGIEEWKRNNPTSPSTTPPSTTPPDEKGALNLLKQQIEELTNSIKEDKQAKALQIYRKELRTQLKEKLGDQVNDYILDDVINGEKWDTKKAVADIIGEAEKTYATKYKKCFGNGPAPRTQSGGGGKAEVEAQNAKKEALMAKLRAAGKLPPQSAEK